MSGFIGSVVAIVVSIIVLMPFGYIGEDMNRASCGDKQYLETGFDYTLNGLIDEKINFKFFDWLISAEEQAPEIDTESDEIDDETICEHSFVAGVCEKCGEAEVPPVTE